MNDMGNYMLLNTLANGSDTPREDDRSWHGSSWNAFSNSSPVEGITKAISTFYQPGRISLYVFGGYGTFHPAGSRHGQQNQAKGDDGRRLVRIHSVGFPVSSQRPSVSETGIKFSILMRALAEHEGTFVALNDFR